MRWGEGEVSVEVAKKEGAKTERGMIGPVLATVRETVVVVVVIGMIGMIGMIEM